MMPKNAVRFIDYGIITAQPEEFAGLRDVFPKLREKTVDTVTFYRGSIPLPGHGDRRDYQVVVTFLNRQGQLDAATVAKTLIQHWKPEHLVLSGIAGRMDDELNLGDVVVSSNILYYEPGKATDHGVTPRPVGWEVNDMLLNRVNAFSVDKAAVSRWRRACAKCYNGPGSLSPSLRIGAIASGELLVASEAMKRKVRRLHSRLSAIEMEAAGVMRAAGSEEPPIPTIIFRGISDRADKSKSVKRPAKTKKDLSEQELQEQEQKRDKEKKLKDAARLAAIQNSALCLLAFLRRRPSEPLMTDRFKVDLKMGTARETRSIFPTIDADQGLSLPCFPNLVELMGPAIGLTIDVEIYGKRNAPLPLRALGVIRSFQGAKTPRLEHVDGKNSRGKVSLELVPGGEIGLYSAVEGELQRIHLCIKTLLQTEEREWKKSRS